MTKLYRSWTRRGLLGAALAVGCNRKPEHARVDPALAPLIPADTTGLVGVRLDLLKQTPGWGHLSAGLLAGLRERTAIDVLDDLYEVIYCVGGKNQLALLRGKFTDGGVANSGLEPDLKIPGGQKLPYKGLVLQGREDAAVVFFNSSVALAGRAAALRDAIDARNAREIAARPLIASVATLPHEGLVYLVSNQPRLPAEGLAGLKSLPFTLQSLAAWITFGTAARLAAVAQTKSDEAAREAAAGLRGLLSMAAVANADSPWAVLAKSARVEAAGAQLQIDAELSLAAAVRMLALADE